MSAPVHDKSARQQILALFVMCIAGCATTSSTSERAEYWTYSGPDEALRVPPRVPRGDLSAGAWMIQMRVSEAAWLEKREELIEQAKDACARETGESKTPGYWFGFGSAFKDCMKARGWSVGRSAL